MDDLGRAIGEAFRLIGAGDAEVLAAAKLSLGVSLSAVLLAALAGVPLGVLVGGGQWRGRTAVTVLLHTLLALPTVLIGLLLFGLLARRGPLGGAGLLYTPWAMVLGQCILALPIIAALTAAAVGGLDPRVRQSALTLGAGRRRTLWTLASEARLGILAAVVAAFGRVIGEVGVSMMVGGNIRHVTRNLTTSIALETSKGEFALGIALGLILMALALGVNLLLQLIRHRRKLRWKRLTLSTT